MADCSKTDIFLGEWQRMCDTVKICMRCDIPIDSITGASCIQFVRKNRETAISIVQKWSDAHPLPKQKTYADVFYEAFPNAVKRGEQYGNRPMTCRDYIFGTGCPFHGRGSDSFEEAKRKCAACWNVPYPEQEN